MSESFLYTWQDSGAPVLTPYKGSIVNVLKKVLVEGYGDKSGLGWEIIFESTEKARYETFCETLKFIYGADFENIMPNWSNDALKEFYSRK